MTQKILGPEGSKRRTRFWLLPNDVPGTCGMEFATIDVTDTTP